MGKLDSFIELLRGVRSADSAFVNGVFHVSTKYHIVDDITDYITSNKDVSCADVNRKMNELTGW